MGTNKYFSFGLYLKWLVPASPPARAARATTRSLRGATRGASVTTAATAATATLAATVPTRASTAATATSVATAPTRASTAATARSTAAPRTAAGNLPFPASYAIICRSRVFFRAPRVSRDRPWRSAHREVWRPSSSLLTPLLWGARQGRFRGLDNGTGGPGGG